jgi:tyrosine-protein kinase Etk/Wzc
MMSAHGDRPDNQTEFDVVALLDTIVSNRFLILFVTLSIVSVAAAWSFLAHPLYQADIMVQIEDSPGTNTPTSIVGDIGSLFDMKSSAAAETQILASRLVVSNTVDTLHLYVDATAKRFPVVGDFVSRFNRGTAKPGVFGVGGYAWGQEKIDVSQFDVPSDFEDDKFSLTVETGGRYRFSGADLDRPMDGQIGATSTFTTAYGPIVLTVDATNAQPGTRFTLIRHSRLKTINDLQSALDVQEKVKQSGVIIAKLTGGDPEALRRTLQEIGNQYARQNIERKSADAAQSLSFLHTQLPVLKTRLDAAEERYTAMRNASGTVDLPEEAKISLQQSAEAKTALLTLQQKRAELATRFGSAHPGMVAMDRQIAALRQQQDALDRSLARLPDLQQQTARLMLDVKVDTDLYTTLLNNAQQLELVKAGKVGSVRIVDTPVVPEEPVKPKRPMVIAAGALVGLVIGLVCAFVRDLLFSGVTTADEIERGIGLDVLASIPLSAAQGALNRHGSSGVSSPHLLAEKTPGDGAIESLRSLRTALHVSRFDGKPSVVLLTGAAPSAGKSFVAANLGALLATGGKRVLIIDGDMRRGHLEHYLGARAAPGLAELIAGGLDEATAVQRLDHPRLDFIAAGTPMLHPDELLMSDRVASLFDRFRMLYDYVLVDAPPMLACADAALLGRAASIVLLVAKAGETRIGDMRESVKRLEHAGVRASGVVLNGVAARTTRCTYGSKYGSFRFTQYDYGAPVERGPRRAWFDALRRKRGR